MHRPLLAALFALVPAAAHAADQPPRVNIIASDDFRYLGSNGVPDHQTGRFPNRHCRFFLKPTEHKFRIPRRPEPADEPRTVAGFYFGVASNGIPYDAAPADVWGLNRRADGSFPPPDFERPEGIGPDNLWAIEAIGGSIPLGLDRHHAHVTQEGLYHYHGIPTGHLAALGGNAYRMTLIGYAADGFPIYDRYGYSRTDDKYSYVTELRSSYQLKRGTRPEPPLGPGGPYDGTYTRDYEFVAGSGDLDEFNGREGVTPDFPGGTYYYVITKGFPFVPRQFRGTPDTTFLKPWYRDLLVARAEAAGQLDPEAKTRLAEIRRTLGQLPEVRFVIPEQNEFEPTRAVAPENPLTPGTGAGRYR